MWSDKRVRLGAKSVFGSVFGSIFVTIFGSAAIAALAVACASSSDARARRSGGAPETESDAWAELEAHADDLFAALEQVAEARDLPITRRDVSRRRLTTDWIEEDLSTRRRYFLSVIVHSAGLAVRAHIVREERRGDGDGAANWQELPPTDDVTAEEGAIIEEAHRIWLDDDR